MNHIVNLKFFAIMVFFGCNTKSSLDDSFATNQRSNRFLGEVIESSKNGDLNGVQRFLDGGGDPNGVNDAGLGPLHHAAVRGHLEVVELLVESGARIGADSTIKSPSSLHLAAQGGHSNIVNYLVSRGADTNSVWLLNGHTPLYEAVFYARVSSVENLLMLGARTDAVNLRGLTASDLAAREAPNNPSIQKILDLLNRHNSNLELPADPTGRFDITAETKRLRLASLLDQIDPPRSLSTKDKNELEQQIRLQKAADSGDLAAVKYLV